MADLKQNAFFMLILLANLTNMPAPKGNSFWKARSKHGRDKIFNTPEILWQAASQYFNWCEKHPWYKNEVIKSGESAGKIIAVPTSRPFTISGLCIFLNVNQKYFNDFKETATVDFSEVITRIEEIIYTQKFEGATIGAFNANIISRDLGLTDKTDVTTGGEKLKTVSDLFPTLEQIVRAADK